MQPENTAKKTILEKSGSLTMCGKQQDVLLGVPRSLWVTDLELLSVSLRTSFEYTSGLQWRLSPK